MVSTPGPRVSSEHHPASCRLHRYRGQITLSASHAPPDSEHLNSVQLTMNIFLTDVAVTKSGFGTFHIRVWRWARNRVHSVCYHSTAGGHYSGLLPVLQEPLAAEYLLLTLKNEEEVLLFLNSKGIRADGH